MTNLFAKPDPQAIAAREEAKAKRPHTIKLQFIRDVDAPGRYNEKPFTKWSYVEINGLDEQVYRGEIKDETHKQALIDKARKNAQERNVYQLVISQDYDVLVNESYQD